MQGYNHVASPGSLSLHRAAAQSSQNRKVNRLTFEQTAVKCVHELSEGGFRVWICFVLLFFSSRDRSRTSDLQTNQTLHQQQGLVLDHREYLHGPDGKHPGERCSLALVCGSWWNRHVTRAEPGVCFSHRTQPAPT